MCNISLTLWISWNSHHYITWRDCLFCSAFWRNFSSLVVLRARNLAAVIFLAAAVLAFKGTVFLALRGEVFLAFGGPGFKAVIFTMAATNVIVIVITKGYRFSYGRKLLCCLLPALKLETSLSPSSCGP